MGYNSLEIYYKTIWGMVHHHGWSISDIEEMVPFERDIYVELTSKHIQEQEAQQRSL